MAGEKKAVYSVKAPLVVTKQEDGTDLYLYQGASVSGLSKDEIERLVDGGFIEQLEDAPAPDDQPVDPYDGKTVPDLEELVKERNEGREDDKKIAPASGKKDDLLAALKADDEASKQ